MIYQTVVALSLLAAGNAAFYSSDATAQKYMWDSYKQDWQKSYASEEIEAKHFKSFVDNLKIIDERNLLENQVNGTAIHGLTRFSDLSQEEFVHQYLTADVTMRSNSIPVVEYGEPSMVMGLVDWTNKLTTPVKDQGYCGSCWAFSATSQIESDSMRTLKTSYVLSPQQLTSCDSTSKGCNGGWPENAYNYVKKTGGIEQDKDYPYTSYQGTTGTCKASSSKYVIKVTGYSTVKGESAMASHVQSTGPLSVCLDASTWNSYNSGIMSSCGKNVNHAVQAVGVDSSSYWKVRNSWGTKWGEGGFIRLKYGANTCAITNDPTFATVSK